MTLRRGSSGPEVKAWQTYLRTQGHAVDVDGVFGGGTEAATRAWQAAQGLEADGVVGPASLARAGLSGLSSAPNAPTPAAPGASAGKGSVAAVRGIERLKPAELGELAAAAKAIGIPTDWLAAVISFETAGTFSTSILNAAGSKAVGLIQFMPKTAQALLGTATPEQATQQAAAMSFGEQLRRMVVPYFKPYAGRLKSLDDVYLAVFYPAFISRQPNEVVAVKDGTNAAVYRQNAGFDKDGKGYVTKSDITSTIRSVLASARGVMTFDAEAVATVAKASALPLLVLVGAAALFVMSRKAA